MPILPRWRLGAVVLLAGTAGCESPTKGNPPPPPPVELRPAVAEVVEGDFQRGWPGEALASPVGVRVTAAGGEPVPGVTVQFAAEAAGAFSPSEAVTDAQGIARAAWTLGPVGMVHRGRAVVPVLGRGFDLAAATDSTRTVWVEAPRVVSPGAAFEVALLAGMDSVPFAPMGPNQVLLPQNAGLVSGTLSWGAAGFEFLDVRGGRPFAEIERATLVAVPGPQGVAITAMEPRAPTVLGAGRIWVARLRAPGAPGRHTLSFDLRDLLSARQFASAREHVRVVGAEVTVQ